MNDKSLLERITQKADRLNELADKAREELTEVENKLVSAGIGIEVWVESGTLGFARVDNTWCIVVKRARDGEISPLRNAPRQVRIEAQPRILPLLNQIDTRLQQEMHEVESAIRQLSV